MNRTTRLSALAAVGGALILITTGMQAAADRPRSADDSAPATKPDRAELERRFAELLTGSTLDGTFRMITEGGLGEPYRDRYVITKAEKQDGDRWLIACRIRYMDKDIPIALTLPVVWADDTPMIKVDGVFIPGAGMYSARVLFQRDCYAGTWFGKGYGGVMSGRVAKPSKKADEASPDKSDKE
ncbi:MAG: hypothetical protein V3T70_06555 [Phycisphaerae bacterium]